MHSIFKKNSQDYPSASCSTLCFIIEYQGQPIGECWLQRMNLERVIREFPGYDVRRIDLMIGEKSLWGKGLGTEVIHLLTGLAFQQESVDYIFEPDIRDFNIRSRRAFEKNDYRLVARNAEPPGGKARFSFDLIAKNPRLGFHAYAIHLFFDSQAENAIRSVWRALAENDVAPYLHHSANRPHFTLSIYRALDLPEARRRLAELAARQPALSISSHYHGIFPGSSPTTFLGPPVTPPLLELQAKVCALLDEIGELPMPAFDYYRPGHWVPHCALATEFDGSSLYEALQIAQRLSLPMQSKICEIGLTEARPVRHLGRWLLDEKP